MPVYHNQYHDLFIDSLDSDPTLPKGRPRPQTRPDGCYLSQAAMDILILRARRDAQELSEHACETPPREEGGSVPDEIATILENTFADDLLFFRRRPGATIRLRPVVAGEFWPDFPEPTEHITAVAWFGRRYLVRVPRVSAGGTCA